MIFRVVTLVALVSVVSIFTGCGHIRGVCCPVDSHSTCPANTAEVTGTRDIQAEVRLQSYEDQAPAHEAPLEYLVLSAVNCQCTAANNSAVANMLQMECQFVDWSSHMKHGATLQNLLMQRDLLLAQSVVKRNTSSALAMKTFYGLAGVEAQAQLLAKGIREIKRTIRRANQLRDEGLAEDIDRSALATQHLQLEDRLAQLRLSRVHLNALLQKLLDCPLAQQTYFWPETGLVAEPDYVDIEFEVARGLELRPELRALRYVHCQLDEKTLPIARSVLQTADSGLGSATETRGLGLIGRNIDNNQEVVVRDQQLRTLIHDTEQTVSVEIRRAVSEVESTRRYVALAHAKVASRRDRLDRLDVQRTKGTATAIDIGIARLQLYEAESSIVNHIVALRVAEIDLKEAQGLLAQECGYEANFCCE